MLPPGGELALGAVAVFGAATVQGVTGFAFGILAVSLLTILWDVRTASVLATYLAVWNVGQTLYSVRQGIRWDLVRLLMLGIVLGQPLGGRALVNDSCEVFLLYLLGAACLVVAGQEFLGRPPSEDRPGPGRAAGLAAGVASGFLTTSVSSGGPPVIWYIYRHPLTKEQLKATCLATFAFGLVLKFILWGYQDLFLDTPTLLTAERSLLALVMLPAAMLGSTTGIFLFRWVDGRRLRRLVCLILVGLAVSLGVTATRTLLEPTAVSTR